VALHALQQWPKAAVMSVQRSERSAISSLEEDLLLPCHPAPNAQGLVLRLLLCTLAREDASSPRFSCVIYLTHVPYFVTLRKRQKLLRRQILSVWPTKRYLWDRRTPNPSTWLLFYSTSLSYSVGTNATLTPLQ